MILPARSRIPTMTAAGWIATVALSALLLRFPPDRYPFYPRCPVYALFHLQCPGCGATRALAALLHGHLRDALHLNPLAAVFFPAALLYLAGRSRLPPLDARRQSYAAYALLAVATVFAVARNLP